MKKLVNTKFSAEVGFKAVILKTIDGGMPLNIGAVTLSVEGRNCILDVYQTYFNNKEKKGKLITFDADLALDFETFEKDETYNYELLVSDLKRKELKVEFFCGTDDMDKGEVDMDNAEITVTITIGEEEIILKGELE